MSPCKLKRYELGLTDQKEAETIEERSDEMQGNL